MQVANQGSPYSPIWVIMEEPYSADEEKGYILSAGHGYTFRKVWSLSGLPECYIYVLKPVIGATYDDKARFSLLLTELETYKPTFILPTSSNLVNMFCPHLVSKSQYKAILKKYSGNLLHSDYYSEPHYIIPQYPPDFVGANWDYHEIQAFIDLGHVKEEYEYWDQYKVLNPLPCRQLIVEPSYDDILSFLYRCRYEFDSGILQYISVDIETIRPKQKSFYHKLGHPGYPYTISLAVSPYYAISYSLWDYDELQLVRLWRELDKLLRDVPQIGQNYFRFDSHFMEALGFRFCLQKCQDTLIRHHILWPGLPHSLQFQTKQYTREPYYKDEGKQWSPKYKASLMRYNCLDTCVTYEVYLAQEKEFNERPHLK
jgi:hypothetical protein